MKDLFEFLSALESHYSDPKAEKPLNLKYTNELEILIMRKYFDDLNFSDFLGLFQKVIIKHSKKWKSLPDISIFNDCISGVDDFAAEHKANMVYAELERKANPYFTFATDDAACEAGLSAVGGWQSFCNRSQAESPFTRKTFISAYLNALKSHYRVDVPRIFYGIHGQKINHQQSIVIGNRKNVLSLSSENNRLLETDIISKLQDKIVKETVGATK